LNPEGKKAKEVKVKDAKLLYSVKQTAAHIHHANGLNQ